MTHKSHPTCIAIPFISYSPMLPKGQTNSSSCGGNGPFCNYIKLKKIIKKNKQQRREKKICNLGLFVEERCRKSSKIK